MDIDRQAPVIVVGSVLVEASPETVWQLLADVRAWPAWNRAVREARLEGPFAPGSRIRWQAGPGRITSVLQEVDPPRLLGWTGRSMGIRAVHVWRLRPSGRGSELTTEESWRGLPVKLAPGRLRASLEQAVQDGLGSVKREAERRARGAEERVA